MTFPQESNTTRARRAGVRHLRALLLALRRDGGHAPIIANAMRRPTVHARRMFERPSSMKQATAVPLLAIRRGLPTERQHALSVIGVSQDAG